MKNVVLVRYGEITLKSERVRREFERILVGNIKRRLDNYRRVRLERGRIFIETNKPVEAASRVADLPGVVSTSPTLKTHASMEQISELAGRIAEGSIEPGQSFAVRARRVGEHDFSSKDVEEEVGRLILEEIEDIQVDLDSPDRKVHVEVRNEDAYVFDKIFPGFGGLPVGSQGRAISLFFGDMYSLMSCFFLLKRGSPVSLLTPTAVGTIEKDRAIEIAKRLLKFHPNIKLHFLPVQELIDGISEEAPGDLRWLTFRRSLLRASEAVAREEGAKAIAIGEDLDEVAANTLKVARIVEEGIDLPILRPLFGFTREEIIDEGWKVGMEVPEEGPPSISWSPPDPKRVDLEEVRRIEESTPVKSFIESALESIETLELEE